MLKASERSLRQAQYRFLSQAEEKAGDLETLKIISGATHIANCAGVCMGRNAFQRDDTAVFVSKVCKVVHGKAKPEEL